MSNTIKFWDSSKFDYFVLDETLLGEVYEIHISDFESEPTFMGNRPLDDFICDWGYALLGRRYDEPVALDDLPPINPHRAYLAVIHNDGAYLKEL